MDWVSAWHWMEARGKPWDSITIVKCENGRFAVRVQMQTIPWLKDIYVKKAEPPATKREGITEERGFQNLHSEVPAFQILPAPASHLSIHFLASFVICIFFTSFSNLKFLFWTSKMVPLVKALATKRKNLTSRIHHFMPYPFVGH